jgi:hypothetical protein
MNIPISLPTLLCILLVILAILVILFLNDKQAPVTKNRIPNRIPIKDYLTFIVGVGIMVLMMTGLLSLILFANC